MKTTFTLTSIFALLFLISACTPLRIVRLEPSEANTAGRMFYGNPVQSQQRGEVVAEVSFYDATPQFVVFNLEITNNGTKAFDFDPATIHLIPNEGEYIPAIDPELELFGLDMHNAKKQKTQRIFAGIGAGLLIAGTIASVSSDNAVNDFDNLYSTTELALDVGDVFIFSAANFNDNSRLHYAVPREDIPFPDSRFFWLDHALRVTTVRPGETVGGKVAFRRFDQADYVDFTLAAGSEEFQFGFHQRVFRP